MSGFYPFDKKHIVLYDKDDFVVALGYGSRAHRGDRAVRAHAFSPRELQDQIAATLAV